MKLTYKIMSYINSHFIGILGWVFTYGPRDRGSISGWDIPKTLKMVLDISLLNTQNCKARIKSQVEQSRERSSTLPNASVSYWKGSLRNALDYGRQLYFIGLYDCISIDEIRRWRTLTISSITYHRCFSNCKFYSLHRISSTFSGWLLLKVPLE